LRCLRVPDLNLSIGLRCTADAFDRRSHRGAKRFDGDLGRPSCACVVSIFLLSL
jgi:hypothetical protein